VVGLVTVFEAALDLHRVVDGGLSDQHGLEAPLEGGVLFDVLAILVYGGGPDHTKLAAGERGFEHVRGIHRALGRPGPDDRVQLVDKHDGVLGVLPDLFYNLLESLLELPAVLGPCDQTGEVELQDPLVCQRLWYLIVHYSLCDALDDRGLADAGVSDEDGVVLGTAAQDLDGGLDLVCPADHGVELALSGGLRKVAAVLV
jgi:hypothetical protein